MNDPYGIEQTWIRTEQESKQREAKDAKARADKKAKQAHYDAMPPAELAREIMDKCDISNLESLADLEERLFKQALTLDSTFFTALHHSGFGQQTNLNLDALKTAMSAQKLCRQTYDTLKPAKPSKMCKQTKECQNNQ